MDNASKGKRSLKGIRNIIVFRLFKLNFLFDVMLTTTAYSKRGHFFNLTFPNKKTKLPKNILKRKILQKFTITSVWIFFGF